MVFTIAICGGIVILAILVFRKLIHQNKVFHGIKVKFEDGTIIAKQTVKMGVETKIHNGERNRIDRSTYFKEDEGYDPDELKRYKERYLEAYAEYVSWSQMIAVFPLLGIFGTVLGLVVSGGLNSIDLAMAGLSTAMWTTLIGLIASIGLKIIDALIPGKMVNLVEAQFAIADEALRLETIKDEIKNANGSRDF